MLTNKAKSLHLGLLMGCLAVGLAGCCTGVVTSVRNESGRDIRITILTATGQSNTVLVHPGRTAICDGVWSKNSRDTWIVSDGTAESKFPDVSSIATLPNKFVSASRFTKDFPCNRVALHVGITPDLTIEARRAIGYTESQPEGFPIRPSNSPAGTR
jgi:hypothetical protein